MEQLIVAAFLMGILGSFHCVGMCGPLALSLPLPNHSHWAKFYGAMIYNFGRVLTYAMLGFIFGWLGQSFSIFGYQQALSIILGIAVIVFMVLPKTIFRTKFPQPGNSFFKKIRAALGKLLVQKNYGSLFFIGLLNGLLPCGLVYLAIAGAIATGSGFKGAVGMAFFGLGTLPIMWSIAFFGNYIGMPIRNKIRKAYPLIMSFMACLLILRGMGLGIPYVSPKTNIEKKMLPACCEKPAKHK